MIKRLGSRFAPIGRVFNEGLHDNCLRYDSFSPYLDQIAKGYQHVSDIERKLVKNMKRDGLPWSQIVKIWS